MYWFICIKILTQCKELSCWGLSISCDARFYNRDTLQVGH